MIQFLLNLFNGFRKTLKCAVKTVVVSHFHNDCLGGLNTFHQSGIPSYGNRATIELALRDSLEVPQQAFVESFAFKVGEKELISTYFGAGHTPDNIVTYFPSEQLLFGGCLIKEVDASKGNLADAKLDEWAFTVEKIKKAYPQLKVVVPGHGNPGGAELLDYTMELFKID